MDLSGAGIIPYKQFYHNPKLQNKYGYTVAMLLALRKVEIPPQWYHNPTLTNSYGYTVALYQAQSGIIPTSHWLHNKFYRAHYSYQKSDQKTGETTYKNSLFTVQNFLKMNQIPVPQEWKYEVIDENDNTLEMIQASRGEIPKK